ncbi:hypothetical protein M885DRAFT_506200 [Pelagophyceae sp. CCMP2097]|nr:hypothetical protein M885DRAFT_506200 [Pelagophyceae sp. CCMP2097]
MSLRGASKDEQLKLRGVLEKRGSDGSWKPKVFTVHRHWLYYHEPGVILAENPPRASFNLLECAKVEIIEKKGVQILMLHLDENRKHQLRAMSMAPPPGAPKSPSVAQWLGGIQDRIAIAKQRTRQSKLEDSEKASERANREKIIAFYAKHNPAKLEDIDALLIKYREVGIDAGQLYEAITQKYEKTAEGLPEAEQWF